MNSIAVVEYDGKETQLTDDADDNAPAWSHDGRAILFMRGPRIGDGAALHRWSAGKVESLGLPPINAFAVSPTAEKIVYATVTDPTLFVADLSVGRDPAQLIVMVNPEFVERDQRVREARDRAAVDADRVRSSAQPVEGGADRGQDIIPVRRVRGALRLSGRGAT